MFEYHVHVRRKDDLKAWIPMMAKSSQKNPMRKPTLTSIGAAFFKLLRITYPRLTITQKESRRKTYRSTTGQSQKPEDP